MTELTPRERQVLQLAASMNCRQIALTLGIAHQTVRSHMHGIHDAYGTATKTQAVVTGIARGDIDLAVAYAGIVWRRQ